ncbi:hypothetical protein OsI_01857 [Oryza sativa Indica Group]|uniref:Uncharacterized protein n=1 Tax=Oryza sativa subsp. indica TaxID=39946 RepID=B8A7W2_ORYSI|nr:hypothetical protein OsI_01857 [Oryza sativa Indica Group]
MRREPRGSHHHLDDLACSTALDASYSLASVALAASAALDELASPSGIARAAPSLPLPRVGQPSDEFASRISASDPSTVPPAAAKTSSTSLSPSSSSASSPTLGSSLVHLRPPLIPQPRERALNPSPPKRNL